MGVWAAPCLVLGWVNNADIDIYIIPIECCNYFKVIENAQYKELESLFINNLDDHLTQANTTSSDFFEITSTCFVCVCVVCVWWFL
jgi:hypothetical protein